MRGANYNFGDVPAPATCVASDPTSGLVAPCAVTAGATAVGPGAQVATATDNAGNVATDTRSYTVAAWRLDGSDLVAAVDEFGTTGSTTLRYDATGGQWVQNWATPSSGKGSCYRVTMTTMDGSSIWADFSLR